MRPAVFQVGGVVYWTLLTRNPDTGVLKDADSTPTVAVRKNGSSVADSVTVTKRSATTGIYDCSYNPAVEVEGDAFTLEESATVTGTTTSSATYNFAWNVRCVAVERGTDSANTTTPPTVGAIADAVWDEARSGHATAGTFGEKVNAELDPASVTAVQSGLATSAALTTVGTNVSSILGKLSGITLLKNWLALIMGKTADTGTRAEVNATTAGAGYNETTDSQEAIRDRGDSAWISGGGGGTTTIVTLQAAAGISPGVIVGPSEPLVIGDDYLTVMNRSVRINLLDANGDPAEVVFGTYSLEDSGISIQLLLAKSGKPSTTALIVGTCTFFPAVGSVPPYLIVEFTRTETAKAIPGPYDMQVEAIWNDGKTVTFAPYGQIEFTRNIGRRT